MESFIQLLQNQFDKNSEKPAIIYNSEIVSFGKLNKLVKGISAILQKKGLKKGDRVIVYTPEKLSFLIMHLGIIFSGGISVPLNFNFTEEEMVYFLNDSGARFIFAADRQAKLVKRIKHRCPQLQEIIKIASIKELPLDKKFKEIDILPKDNCFIIYSSGTTGLPKGVVHSHQSTALSLISLKDYWRFSADDILLNVLPLFHIHGLSIASHLALISGSCIILEKRFRVLKTLEKIKNTTVFMAVPTIYHDFLQSSKFRKKAKQWSKMRLFTSGSAPISPDIISEIESVINKPLINRYGMSESHVITSIPLDGPFKRDSVGLPLEGIEIKLVDSNNKILPPGAKHKDGSPAVGEIKIKSESLFKGYWHKSEKTESVFDKDKFFPTGDLGYLDKNGFLFLVGRKNDMIITGGFNVYPMVVERVLNSFPQVKESAVIGIPDRRKGEKVIAVILPKGHLDIKALKRYCIEKLVDYQCPLDFKILRSLPRNAAGKISRKKLSETFIKLE